MNLEKRLKALEDAIKALKAVCIVSASKVKTYVSQSQTFSATTRTVRIKFTPTYNPGGNVITTLHAVVSVQDTPVGFEYSVNEPQDGSGEVVIKVQFEPYSSGTTYQVKVLAFGTSPGTFSVV